MPTMQDALPSAAEINTPLAKQPSVRDEFLYSWWEESVKRNIPLLNDVLRTLLTL